jgi:hypothetical protein
VAWWPWEPPQPPPCDCDPRPVVVLVTITDAAGDVRAVRTGEFMVRPHRHHGHHHDG